MLFPGIIFSAHENRQGVRHCLHFTEKETEAQKFVGSLRAQAGAEPRLAGCQSSLSTRIPANTPTKSYSHLPRSAKAEGLSLGNTHASWGGCWFSPRQAPVQGAWLTSPLGGDPARIVTHNCTAPFISGNLISNSSPNLMARKA